MKYVNELSSLYLEMFTISELYGRKTIYDIIAKDYDKKTVEFSEDDFTPSEAIQNLIDQMDIKQGTIYQTMLSKEKKARIIAVLSYEDYIERLNTKLSNSLEDGKGYKDWLKEVKKDGLDKLVENKGYINTVYSTNISTSFNAGRIIESERLKEYIEFQQFTTQGSGVAEVCQSLSGEIREFGGFKDLIPPLHFNCQSTIHIISKIRADIDNVKATPKSQQSNIKPDKGFGNPLAYRTKLPKETMDRLKTDSKTNKIINHSQL